MKDPMCYIVTRHGNLTALYQEPGYAKGVLYSAYAGRAATCFESRREARNAINRTRHYVRRKGYQWGNVYCVVACVPGMRG